jgi:MFS family permease
LYFCWIGGAFALLARIVIPAQHKPTAVSTHALADVIQVLKNKQVIIVCICSGLMLGPLEGFADVWGAGFLQSLYNIPLANAAGITSLMYLGMLLGAPGLTYLADRSGAHVKVIIASGIFMMVAFLAMLMGFGSPQVLSVLLTAVGVFCAYQIIAIYVATTFVRERLVGLTTAFANMIIMAFGYVFHSSIGLLMGDHQQNGNFSLGQYQVGLSVIPIALAIGVVGFTIHQYRKK